MFRELYEELAGNEWRFHRLHALEENAIALSGISLDPLGVAEVMQIKEIADRYRLHTVWDGENIRIIAEHGLRKH